MLEPATGALDGRRNHVAPIDDGRGPDHEHHPGSVRQGLLQGLCQRLLPMLATGLPRETAADCREPPTDDLRRLVQHPLPGTRQAGLDQGHLQGPEGRDLHGRSGTLQNALGLLEALAGHGEGDDLDGRQQLT